MAACVLATYCIALALPAVRIESDGNTTAYGQEDAPDPWAALGTITIYGHQALRAGWEGRGIIPELSNVALLLAWTLFLVNKNRFAMPFAAAAVVLALTAPAILEINVRELRAGYYFWLASSVIMLAITIANARSERRLERKPIVSAKFT